MRHTLIPTLAALCLLPASVMAQDTPVVVELFTAQGCPSCPPADAFLEELAAREDVIALSLHVDYWDYIGWEDTFGKPEHTERQRGYAETQGQKMVYTPQMVINGTDHAVGTHRIDVTDLIDAHLGEGTDGVSLDVSRDGEAVRVVARASDPQDASLSVKRLHIVPEARVDIKHGENAGRVARHVNIVTEIEDVANWNMRSPLRLDLEASSQRKSLVVLQQGSTGPILAAKWLHE